MPVSKRDAQIVSILSCCYPDLREPVRHDLEAMLKDAEAQGAAEPLRRLKSLVESWYEDAWGILETEIEALSAWLKTQLRP